VVMSNLEQGQVQHRSTRPLRRLLSLALPLACGALFGTCLDGGPDVASIEITSATQTLDALGLTIQYQAQAVGQDGAVLAEIEFRWSSSNPNAASIDSLTGLATAVGNGSATITASGGGASASTSLTVAQLAADVSVTPSAASFTALLDTVRIAATVTDRQGNAVDQAVVSWTSSSPSVAEVDANGLVTARRNGIVTVNGTVDGTNGSAQVTVAQAVEQITITPDSVFLCAITARYPLAANAVDRNNQSAEGVSIVWSGTDQAIEVDAVGLVTARANGAAWAVAQAQGKADSAIVVVQQTTDTAALGVPEAGALDVGDCEAPHNTGRLAEFFAFAANADDIFTLRLQSAEIDGHLFLLDSVGVVLDSNDDCPVFDGLRAENSCLIDFMVPEDGWYTMEATSRDSNQTGAYTLLVEESPCTLNTVGDADGDRLPDCVETNTGAFVSVVNTGTDPNDPDTDGDAIPDGDEVLGTQQGLDLPTMGTNPLRQDILLEYDWFDDALECGAHSHRPTPNAVAMVTAAFANSPVLNPDGTTGINFIHDYGQGGVFTGGNLIGDADGVLVSGVGGAEFLGYKSANFDANRNGYFHYTMLPHRYNTNSSSSGQAEIAGDDMIVSLYCAGSNTNVAHTIVHELGHNLNLRHGGFENTNYKPNYNSVMNYKYQFPGIDDNCTPPGDGVLDYSIGVRLDLNENNLDETQGTCGDPPGPGWDWNGDGDALDVGIVFDINVDGGGTGDGFFGILQDYNDWAFLFLGGLFDADGTLAAQEIVSCTNPAPVAGQTPGQEGGQR
jgi:uncharacterized protein YjdB